MDAKGVSQPKQQHQSMILIMLDVPVDQRPIQTTITAQSSRSTVRTKYNNTTKSLRFFSLYESGAHSQHLNVNNTFQYSLTRAGYLYMLYVTE